MSDITDILKHQAKMHRCHKMESLAVMMENATDRNHKVGVVIPDSESPPARERDKKAPRINAVQIGHLP